MNFSFGATPQQTTQQQQTGFTFSQTQQPNKGFPFGGAGTLGGGGFSFGAPATTASSTGFSFGAAQTNTNTGFGFGSTPASTATGFPFGTPTTSASSGFAFTTPATSSNTGFPFGAPATTTTGFAFAPASTAPIGTGFSFGQTAPTSGTGFAMTTPSNTSSTGFGLNAAPAFPFGAPAATTTASTGFSFGAAVPTPTAGFGFGAAIPATTAATTGFTFGQSAASSPFALGQPAATAVSTALPFGNTPTFGFGSTTSQPSSVSSSINAAQPTPVSAGFAFAQTKPEGLGLAFGAPATAVNTGFGQPAATTAVCGSAFSFGPVSQSTTTTTMPLSFGASAQTNAGLGLAFGAPATAVNTGFGQPAATTAGSAFSFGPVSQSTTTTTMPLSFGASAQTNAGSVATTTSLPSALPTGFALPISKPEATALNFSTSTAATTTAPGFSFGVLATSAASVATTASSFVNTSLLGKTTSAPSFFPTSSTSLTMSAPSSLMFGDKSSTSVAPTSTTAVLSTTTTVTPASAATLVNINFRQLEDTINKWKIELDEQEKVFLNQATQVNAWDRLLISNAEKIITLNDAVERVKLDQQRLDNEMEFITTQQNELEELLAPLEKSVESVPPISVQQHADFEREHTFHLAENIDAQLKRMSEDIKEIIEHVNTANKSPDENDPVQQIAKILNAHMDALQWVDHHTVTLQRKLEETSKICEAQQKEHEKMFRETYNAF